MENYFKTWEQGVTSYKVKLNRATRKVNIRGFEWLK